LPARRAGTRPSFSRMRKTCAERACAGLHREGALRQRGPVSGDSPALKKKMGLCVPQDQGELKGCIGYLRGEMPLDETVTRMAVEAAFHDPRFAPLDADEWEHTEIEISVLTPMKKIRDVNEIQVGVHGLYIENGGSSGLLLPQVATENGWDRQTFLEYTCMKAGLPNHAWQSDQTNIYIFSADVF